MNKDTNPFIIAITGSKGKTTVTRLVDHLLQKLGVFTLRVDSDGHYINGHQKSTNLDSIQLHGYVTTICPGRYLYELREQDNAVAILEESLDCSRAGTGYRAHDIGIFTNVTDEHIGRRIKSREELAEEKARYIFRKITPGGTAIFNADDELVVNQLTRIKPRKQITLIPIGKTFSYFDLKNHLQQGGMAFGIEGSTIMHMKGKAKKPLFDVRDIGWTFDGHYEPSVWNIAFAVAAIHMQQNNTTAIPKMHTYLRQYQPNKLGGRLVRLSDNERGLTIIIDYAHSKQSLLQIASLAKRLTQRKTIGIIRLAPDRPVSAIKDIAKSIANKFDIIIVYDKVDGVTRKTYHDKVRNIKRGVGETARELASAIKQHQTTLHTVHIVIPEKEAIAKGFSLAKKDDVIVHISNDDHARTLSYIQERL